MDAVVRVTMTYLPTRYTVSFKSHVIRQTQLTTRTSCAVLASLTRAVVRADAVSRAIAFQATVGPVVAVVARARVHSHTVAINTPVSSTGGHAGVELI